MPNLSPPLTTVEGALAYKERLQKIDPRITYLMTLYLHPSLTAETIREAKRKGIVGVKFYPAGVTTGSDQGVTDGGLERFDGVFKEMEKTGLVLNLHGECPSSSSPSTTGVVSGKSSSSSSSSSTNPDRQHTSSTSTSLGGRNQPSSSSSSAGHEEGSQTKDIEEEKAEEKEKDEIKQEGKEDREEITILNAEALFLPTLLHLHSRYPNLRIVLEHCTTASAISTILEKCGPNVRGTITAHHLFLTVDDWAGDVWNYCKPVAKTPRDRDELLKAIVYGEGRFFFGSDSAPHDISNKVGMGMNMTSDVEKKGGLGLGMNVTKKKAAAGVFTQPFVTQIVLSALEEGIERGVIREEDVTREMVEGFLGGWGREFYFPDGVLPPRSCSGDDDDDDDDDEGVDVGVNTRVVTGSNATSGEDKKKQVVGKRREEERIVLTPPLSSIAMSPSTWDGKGKKDGKRHGDDAEEDQEGKKRATDPKIEGEREEDDNGDVIPQMISNEDSSIKIIPFKAGERTWGLRWI